MRLIDVLRQTFAEAAATGHRVAAWRLDHAAIAQLRKEAAAEDVDIPSISSPLTFLGVPIEEVPMSGAAQSDIVWAHRKYVPCRHDGRPIDRQWDIFDLDAIEPLGAFYATKDDAERAATGLQLGVPIGR